MTGPFETDSPGRKEAFWQRPTIAADYLATERLGIPLAREQLDAMIRVIRAVGCPTSSVLDVGAGDGELVAIVAGQFPVNRITLVDFSRPMLRGAIARFTGWGGEVDLIEPDLAEASWQGQLPQSVAPYDLVVSRYAIHHLPNERKQTLFGEILELLTPGGLFVNIEHVASSAEIYTDIFDSLMIEGISANSPTTDIESVAAAYHSRWDDEPNNLASADAQCGWLRDTGFVDVDVVMKVFELAVIVARRPHSTR